MPPPFCRAEFATLASNPVPVSARVIRAGFSHELLTLRFRDRDLSSSNYRSGIPVLVEWGIFPRYRERFVGYVHHVTSTAERREAGPPEIEVVAVGATSVMRNEQARNWGATRTDLVVSEIARQHRLGANVDTTPVVHAGLMQTADVSAWKFLIELAKSEGYFLSATMTQINLWNLEQRAARIFDYAPILGRAQIEKFKPTIGETNPSGDESAVASAYAIDGAGVSGFSTTTSPVKTLDSALRPAPRFIRTITGTALAGAADAKQAVEQDARKHRRIYKAKADVVAFPRLRAADPLIIEGHGERQSGVWVVDEVEFSLDASKITSKVKLSRSVAADTGHRPSHPGGTAPSRRRPSPTLVRGQWVDRS